MSPRHHIRNGPQASDARAFTLVELLVVIGIIALLIAILMPTLAKAKRQADTVKCLAQMRQFGVMMQFYASDHGGVLPVAKYKKTAAEPPTSIGAVDNTWQEPLLPYLAKNATNMGQIDRDRSLFFACPTWYNTEWSNTLTDSSRMIGIGLNPFPKAPEPNATADAIFRGPATPNPEIAWYEPSISRWGKYYKLSQYQAVRPSERALMGDTKTNMIHAYSDWSISSSGVVANAALAPRHNGDARIVNIMFCDFSAASLSFREAVYSVRMKTP